METASASASTAHRRVNQSRQYRCKCKRLLFLVEVLEMGASRFHLACTCGYATLAVAATITPDHMKRLPLIIFRRIHADDGVICEIVNVNTNAGKRETVSPRLLHAVGQPWRQDNVEEGAIEM